MIAAETVNHMLCSAIIKGLVDPIWQCYYEGQKAHEDGKAFHEHNYLSNSAEALSWRIGWNARALQERT